MEIDFTVKHPSRLARIGYADYLHASDRQCPLCNAYLLRTPRRPVDRLWSIFRPVLRYRCRRFACQWQGNLVQRSAARPPGSGAPGSGADGEGTARTARTRDVPMAFIAHLVLALSGCALVILVGTADAAPVNRVVGTDPAQDNPSGSGNTQAQPLASQRMRADATPGGSRTTVREAERH